MSVYIGNIPTPQATQTRDTFTATSGQTSFATSGYTPNFLDVYLNGVHLVNGTDYTASNGSDVVLTTGATTGDNLEVVSYSTYEVNAQTYTGGLTAKNDGAAAITANRLSSDGTILDLKKDGTTVAAIGVADTDNVYFSATTGGGSGLRFWGAGGTNPLITPMKEGVVSDAEVDFGRSANRFKDLYLSGGVYLGGTGSANLLDDYEEGTWTPVDASGAGLTFTIAAGMYTKVGRLVVASFRVQFPSTASTAALVISGLPFNSAIVGSQEHQGSALRYTNQGTAFTLANNFGTTIITPLNYSGAQFTNANFSTKYIDAAIIYHTP